MDAKKFKVFIWLGVVVALLLMSSEVSAVKDLTEKAQVETEEKNGVKDHEYGVSLIGVNCGKKNCCVAESNRFGSYCVECCK
ncbi:hypothetical protein MKW98_005242 [Papaver atlanticum]|uniref:Uncharacterized protein n=1 Tax=Papaver atlanticum TaxID=357466 RepID=A0AAD4RX71_9MAGN|nr:hypothetical protein MKW98_005242 [Papaver atlanticum]